MNLAAILALALSLVQPVVLGIETVIGDAKAGKAKKQIALDAVSAAAGIADTSLTGQDKVIADTVTGIVSTAIDAAVTKTRATGEYQEATKAAAPAPVPAAAAASEAEVEETAGA